MNAVLPHTPATSAGSVAAAGGGPAPDKARSQPADWQAITLSWSAVLTALCGTALWVGSLLALPWLVVLILAPTG